MSLNIFSSKLKVISLKSIYFVLCTLYFILNSCHHNPYISSISNQTQKVSSQSISDPKLDSLIAPYKTQMDNKMNAVISYNPKEMKKGAVESELGNWVANAMKWYVDSALSQSSDVAFCNLGGIRVKSLAPGEIQLKHIFELMPFDNTLVAVELDSAELEKLLMIIVEKNGWPVSKGFQMTYSDGKLISWKINGSNSNRKYKILISDYLADGGENLSFLISKPKQEYNILIRDILIVYAKYQKNLSALKEGRMIKINN